MATFNLTITYPDAQQTRILAAMKATYASNGTPNPTNAQAIEALRLEVAQRVKNIVQGYEQQQAAAAVVPVDAV
jgi:hypothetical protein